MKLTDIRENQYRYKVPELPRTVLLKGGFFAERGSTDHSGVTIWHVGKMFEDDQIAVVRMRPSTSVWTWLALHDSTEIDNPASGLNFYNMKLFTEFCNKMLKFFEFIDES